MSRKMPLTGELVAEEPKPSPATRAAQAAARVAERYKNAPSYSEMLAAEARAAVAAAEVASRAALEAQAAAESVLASIEAASAAEESPRTATLHLMQSAESVQESESHAFLAPAEEFFTEPVFELMPEPAGVETELPAPMPAGDGQGFAIRWEPDMPTLRRDPELGRVSPASGYLGFADSDRDGPHEVGFSEPEIGVIEPAQPIFANLIEFPRELVAARKVRPRLVETALGSMGQDAQLSIFEVDPAHISTEPEVQNVAIEAQPAWAEPEWSRMQLGAEPEEELGHEPEPAPQVQRKTEVELAPLSRRLLSLTFDVALIGAAFVTAVLVAETRTAALPTIHAVEIGAAFLLLAVAALYQALFFTLSKSTPGMRYAQVSLCTFDGQVPTRAQRTARLVAMLISVLPLGLGMVWSVFDEDHLTWHDRLSHTYLRRN